MELYAQTELDEFASSLHAYGSGAFIVVRVGWFSYAFLRETGTREEAIQQVLAMRALAE